MGDMGSTARRDSIIAYLRRRVVKWRHMASHAQADNRFLVAERFAAAARLTDDVIADLEVDVDLMPEVDGA